MKAYKKYSIVAIFSILVLLGIFLITQVHATLIVECAYVSQQNGDLECFGKGSCMGWGYEYLGGCVVHCYEDDWTINDTVFCPGFPE